MKICRLPLVFLGLVLFVSSVQAKKKHHDNNYGAGDTKEASVPVPKVDPAALPSTSLQPFLDSHLDHVLAPMGSPNFSRLEIVSSLKTNYLVAMAGVSADRKPMFAAAADVCDALTTAITARQRAVDAWRGSNVTHSSEVVQPHGGRKVGRAEKRSEDNFFRHSVGNDWTQQTTALREKVTALDLRERTLEQQVASTPPAPVAPVLPAQ